MKTPALLAAPIAIVTTVALAACAPVEGETQRSAMARETRGAVPLGETQGRKCFFPWQVSSYRDAPDGPNGDQRLFIDVGASDTYLFEASGACPDIDFSDRVALKREGVGRICDGLDVELVNTDRDFGPRRCPVRMVSKVADRAR